MARNPLIRRRPRMTGKTTGGHKSAGILDDHAVRKNVATKEGTIEHVPTQDNHIANKKYVDELDNRCKECHKNYKNSFPEDHKYSDECKKET